MSDRKTVLVTGGDLARAVEGAMNIGLGYDLAIKE